MAEQHYVFDSSWWILFFALCGSVALSGQRVLQLFLGYRPRNHTEWLNTFLTTIVVAVLAVDGVQLVDFREHLELNALLRVSIVVVTVLAVWLQSQLAYRSQLANARWRRSSVLALLLTWVSIAMWSSHRFYTAIEPIPMDQTEKIAVPGRSVPSTRYVGVTDRGREISLLRWKAPNDQELKALASTMSLLLGPLPSVIQRQEPDLHSNCHGWVFTRGRFLLVGNDVERILEDNRYEPVTLPQDGDVVIYRDIDGRIVHSGLVVGILSDGSVMVESKWSVGCRFLHQPADQPYSRNFGYYRTSRRDHSLVIRFQNRPSVAEQDRSPRGPAAQGPVTTTGKAFVMDAG